MQLSRTDNKRWYVGFKVAVRGNSGAGGLVAPLPGLPCTAYFGKLAKLFGCSLPHCTASVGLVYLYTYHSLAIA